MRSVPYPAWYMLTWSRSPLLGCAAKWVGALRSGLNVRRLVLKLVTCPGSFVRSPLPVWPDILFLTEANSCGAGCVWLSDLFDNVLQARPLRCNDCLIASKLTLGWLVAMFECPSVCVVHMRPQCRGDCIWTSPLLVLPFNVYLCRFGKRSPLV